MGKRHNVGQAQMILDAFAHVAFTDAERTVIIERAPSMQLEDLVYVLRGTTRDMLDAFGLRSKRGASTREIGRREGYTIGAVWGIQGALGRYLTPAEVAVIADRVPQMEDVEELMGLFGAVED